MRPLAIALASVTLLAGGACNTQHHQRAELVSMEAAPPLPTTTTSTTTAPAPATTIVRTVTPTWPKAPRIETAGSGRCGGDLPPCSVMYCENGGKLTGENPRSTASGKWQILDSTWAGYQGYTHAQDAPESVQDAKARQIYAGGRGRSQWVC